MNISELCIRRPVMTTLVTAAISIFGVMAYRALPVSDLPNIDLPTLSVSASLPGASPETMASSVASITPQKSGVIEASSSIRRSWNRTGRAGRSAAGSRRLPVANAMNATPNAPSSVQKTSRQTTLHQGKSFQTTRTTPHSSS